MGNFDLSSDSAKGLYCARQAMRGTCRERERERERERFVLRKTGDLAKVQTAYASKRCEAAECAI